MATELTAISTLSRELFQGGRRPWLAVRLDAGFDVPGKVIINDHFRIARLQIGDDVGDWTTDDSEQKVRAVLAR